MEQKSILNNYFEYKWKPNYNNRNITGYSLLNKLNHNQSILDIGCGFNLFKKYFPKNLYGIDPANDAADERVDIENFNSVGFLFFQLFLSYFLLLNLYQESLEQQVDLVKFK